MPFAAGIIARSRWWNALMFQQRFVQALEPIRKNGKSIGLSKVCSAWTAFSDRKPFGKNSSVSFQPPRQNLRPLFIYISPRHSPIPHGLGCWDLCCVCSYSRNWNLENFKYYEGKANTLIQQWTWVIWSLRRPLLRPGHVEIEAFRRDTRLACFCTYCSIRFPRNSVAESSFDATLFLSADWTPIRASCPNATQGLWLFGTNPVRIKEPIMSDSKKILWAIVKNYACRKRIEEIENYISNRLQQEFQIKYLKVSFREMFAWVKLRASESLLLFTISIPKEQKAIRIWQKKSSRIIGGVFKWRKKELIDFKHCTLHSETNNKNALTIAWEKSMTP